MSTLRYTVTESFQVTLSAQVAAQHNMTKSKAIAIISMMLLVVTLATDFDDDYPSSTESTEFAESAVPSEPMTSENHQVNPARSSNSKIKFSMLITLF